MFGQAGSGKTHVVQKLVFEAVQFIWPARSIDEPTLMVVASSNAQAKNISTDAIKARTLHNAGSMRVQKYVNEKMRPGDNLPKLECIWGNMLDLRAMYGRSKAYDVCEANYKQAHHAFGRVPIVIHLGDFFALQRQKPIRNWATPDSMHLCRLGEPRVRNACK